MSDLPEIAGAIREAHRLRSLRPPERDHATEIDLRNEVIERLERLAVWIETNGLPEPMELDRG